MESFSHNPLILLIVQFIVIIGLSRLIGRVSRLLGQPLVIAEVVAGIILGPSLLGWLAPDAMQALFPSGSLPVLKMFSQVGLVLFMFLIGLEFDPKLLKGRGHASVLISHTSILVPFALGSVAALWLYPLLSEPSVPFSSFLLFMGVAMSITAFPVLARILTERRLLQSRMGAITITCAAVDDVTAWCLLAFVVSVARATDLTQAALTTLMALLYIVAMLVLVRPLLARLGARVSSREGLNQNVVAVTLLLLLASSWITEHIGIHALFGAFLFGAIVPKERELPEALVDKFEDMAVVLLLPLFFAYSGLRTQVGLLDSAQDWAMCGLIILVACVGKFGGSALAARFTGLSWRESGALGVLMNTRGLMELIVLNIGLDLGVISPTLFTMMVVMALVTTFITTPLLKWIYPLDELARDRAVPAPAVASPTPFTVLMCVSSGQTGPAMVSLGKALAGEQAEATRLYALHLIEPVEHASLELRREPPAAEAEEGALAPLLARAQGEGLQVRPLSFVSAEPALDICRTAEAKRADLILLGWHAPLLGTTLLGDTVHEVMREASTQVAVLVDRGLEASPLRRVLVPLTGHAQDRAVLRLAQRILQHTEAQLTVLQTLPPDRALRSSGRWLRVDEFLPEQSGRVRHKVVASSSPEEVALEEARQGYDLVVVGVGAEVGLEGRLFGLNRERIIRNAPTSLLVVRHMAPTPEAQVGYAREPVETLAAGSTPGAA